MTYTTVQGDMWDRIAFNLAGTVNAMTSLLQANPDYIEFVVFPAGIVLNVPDFEIELPTDLPPWRTGVESVE